jgi:hypothetical protein
MSNVLDMVPCMPFLTRAKDEEASIKKSLWLNAWVKKIISHLNLRGSIPAGGMNILCFYR